VATSSAKHIRMRPPLRRVLVIDAGGRRIKLLLVHGDFGRLRILRHELIDLKAEGLVSAEEIQAHLGTVIRELGHPPLGIVLPEHLSTSLVIDLPSGPGQEVEKQLADEAVKLSGVSESRIVYDFARLETAPPGRQQFWVTFCPEGNMREQISQLGVENEDICEITTVANALISAHRLAKPAVNRAILVHMGAETTVMAAVNSGHGAFATTFQTGSDYFTRTLARVKNISEDAAEELKRSVNLLEGPDACPDLIAAVDEWADEVRRQVGECFRANPELRSEGEDYALICGGGGFDQPGLLQFLENRSGIKLRPWSTETVVNGLACPKGFEVALGAAVQALGYSAQPVSLLPEDYRVGWSKRLGRQRLELASLGVVILCILALALGTWSKLTLINSKEALLHKVQTGQEALRANETLTRELLGEYENLRPILAAKQNTRDTLKTLALLQSTRTNQNLWHLVLADQRTYFSLPPLAGSAATNRAFKTNIQTELLETQQPPVVPMRASVTNANSARPGVIAELCVPGEPEASRRALGDLVDVLKNHPLYSQADLLSEDLRRNLADPRLLLPDRHFVLALNFAEAEFRRPVRRPRQDGSPNGSAKRQKSFRPAQDSLGQDDP
jgi:Tfp pilus assembly PilM family ATPase